ncbi:MAG TPA: anion permease [Paracoccaceae bacterium]|nr:anion permease [Paracoccaceae bacterium]
MSPDPSDVAVAGPAAGPPYQRWAFYAKISLALLFVAAAGGYALLQGAGDQALLVVAAAFGAYMALNIGANDVANNVGPAVGAKVLTLGGALAIAAVFEAAGAIIAGGDVVGTIRGGIIDPAMVPDERTFIWLMMAALLAAALWVNVATASGAPVSTSHSIVGGVLGAGIAASGVAAVDWPVMGAIAASWVVSPVSGAAISAAIMYFIHRTILEQSDSRAAACRVVPLLVGGMAWAFASYLMVKGLSEVWPVPLWFAILAGSAPGVAAWAAMRAVVRRRIGELRPGLPGVNRLLPVPLAFAAALLSFAHGSNDVANAIGPLAAIVDVLAGAEITAEADVPLWVMLIGALGLALGLGLFGARVIRTIGSELTKLDPVRAYCIAMSAALTVIVASWLGLPISTTHVTVGAVLGVGFLREAMRTNYERRLAEIKAHHAPGDQAAIDDFMARFTAAPLAERGRMLRGMKKKYRKAGTPAVLSKQDRRLLKKEHKRELVKRATVMKIAAAWVVTVPATGIAAAMIFFMLRGMLLP